MVRAAHLARRLEPWGHDASHPSRRGEDAAPQDEARTGLASAKATIWALAHDACTAIIAQENTNARANCATT